VPVVAIQIMTGERMTKIIRRQPAHLPLKNDVGKMRVARALHHDNAAHKMQRQAGVGTAIILVSLGWRCVNLIDHAVHQAPHTETKKMKSKVPGSYLSWIMWKRSPFFSTILFATGAHTSGDAHNCPPTAR
jgi:hypothetical protein